MSIVSGVVSLLTEEHVSASASEDSDVEGAGAILDNVVGLAGSTEFEREL
jgi:hypothetical protein